MKNHALLVGLGILFSRFSGLIRERIFAYYFGNSDAADAFKAALKIPNFLQNLFGEGVLSATFIPVYAELIGKKHDEEARKVASVIGSLLFLVTSILVLLGVVATPWLIELIAPGFQGEKKQLTISLVQIFFPGTGFLVMSAWCLGILNSHKKFFLSYVAPVVWNLSIIAAMVYAGSQSSLDKLAVITAYGLVAGSILQFVVQLPFAIRLAGKLRPSVSAKLSSIKIILKNFIPVVFSRGVVQVSSYIDNILASLLPSGAVSAISYAQTLYLLPISLFGMSVSASELPTMSQAQGSAVEIKSFLVTRLNNGFKKLLFFVAPSMIAFILLGDVVVAALFKTGAFGTKDVLYVWLVLVGYALGLLMATQGRLYSSSFYALKDVSTPLRFAIIRVIFSAGGGYLASKFLPSLMGLDQSYGTVGLTVAASIATGIEFFGLKWSSQKAIGKSGIPFGYSVRIWIAALTGGSVGLGINYFLKKSNYEFHPILVAACCFGVFGVVYLGICICLKIEHALFIYKKVTKKLLR